MFDYMLAHYTGRSADTCAVASIVAKQYVLQLNMYVEYSSQAWSARMDRGYNFIISFDCSHGQEPVVGMYVAYL